MSRYVLIDAPSILGLRPTGVELLPEALKAAGLQAGLDAGYAGRLEPPPYEPRRDPETLLLNPTGLRIYAQRLADAISGVLREGKVPVVLGGDCSNLIGCALALRRAGRYGLFFIDGHADFYQPEAEPNGEVASMDLAIVSGRGPRVLTDIEGLQPLVRDEDIVAFAYRDAEEQREHGSQDICATAIHTFPLDQVRAAGIAEAAEQALRALLLERLQGMWIHLDADVLDDAIMPAVDYRMPDGLGWDELSTLLQVLTESGKVVGINIGIFNPRLDESGSLARRFTECLVAGLMPRNS
ncbi:MAG TPA: arginase family protein [Thermoanaerobaculia bacterium]|jgi:arginase|nr:arginase family protein [Thermoanaerobaculia bacterium]